MFPKFILLASLGLFWRLLKRDIARREGISSAIWIPTLWVAIIGSRPLSMWLGFGGATSTIEGSPLDGFVFLVLILAALITLSRRGLNWPLVLSENWPIFLFYFFLLLSVLWANSPFASFKRWFKEFGNIPVLLVILTEAQPQEALRAVFVRCAYLLLPLSLVFIRYFPALGRFYSGHGGEGEMTGVTTQKNSLGVLVLVCGLILLWDWLRLSREHLSRKTMRMQNIIHWGLLLLGVYLLHLCHSATAILCLSLGAAIIWATRLPLFRHRLRGLAVAALAAILAFWIVDQLFGIKADIVAGLGRDMTFTGRTDVWRELLNLRTDPVFGVGFMSLWDDARLLSKLPDWLTHSAHNGYLEEYLAGGWVGIFFLIVMLLGAGLRIIKDLTREEDYGAVRFAVYLVFLLGNFSESNIACMTPIGFLFLLAAIGYAQTVPVAHTVSAPISASDDLQPSGAGTSQPASL